MLSEATSIASIIAFFLSLLQHPSDAFVAVQQPGLFSVSVLSPQQLSAQSESGGPQPSSSMPDSSPPQQLSLQHVAEALLVLSLFLLLSGCPAQQDDIVVEFGARVAAAAAQELLLVTFLAAFVTASFEEQHVELAV
tara:strand:- start:857 stop:1267 length:411 start_codon:yes stop_codon:yes gene_type:complete